MIITTLARPHGLLRTSLHYYDRLLGFLSIVCAWSEQG